MEVMGMKPWTALWTIEDIPDGGFDVIRDGRPVGIPRCYDFDQAVEEIVNNALFEDWDRVVCHSARGDSDVDVASYRQEMVGS